MTKDLRGHSALKLPIGGRGVVAHDGDDGAAVRRAVSVLRDAIVITETLVGESKPLSVCRRTLQRDGRMRTKYESRLAGVHGGVDAAQRRGSQKRARGDADRGGASRR